MRLLQSVLLICFLGAMTPANAQVHQPVFSDLSGDELLTALEDSYKPSSVPSSNFARDVLYAEIYNVNGFVSCVYTGFTINLPAGDPSSGAFSLGINAEHTMPRSFLEGTNREFDLHNLYPTRENVNSARSTFPFSEIGDNQTDVWYYLDSNQSGVPNNNIDLYSEKVNGFFEPREDHKGNVARTMMYTYAVYGDVIEGNAPQYFEQQRQTLCEWHVQDPVDQMEFDRTYQIATYQQDIPNPFVLDCTLASRAFCQDVNIECVLPPTSSVADENSLPSVNLTAQNPFFQETKIAYTLPETANFRLSIYDAQGKTLQSVDYGKQNAGTYSLDFSPENGQGLYIIVSEMTIDGKTKTDFLKLIGE